MSIKTIEIPPAQAAHAARLHALLLTPPPFVWELSCPSVLGGAGGLTTPSPRLLVRPDPARAAETPPWLQSFDSIELTTIPIASLIKILRGLDSLALGNVSAKLVRSLSRCEPIMSTSIDHGRLPLPEISIEIPGLPDPRTEALTALANERAFLLHLRGLLGSRFDVRLTF